MCLCLVGSATLRVLVLLRMTAPMPPLLVLKLELLVVHRLQDPVEPRYMLDMCYIGAELSDRCQDLHITHVLEQAL